MDSLGAVTVSDRAIIALAGHIARNTEGVAAISDRSGKTNRGRIYMTPGRDLEIFLICRYGTNTTAVCRDINARLRELLGDAGAVQRVIIKVTGAVK